MKRIIAFFVALFLFSQCFCVIISASDNFVTDIMAINVMEGGQNEGYFDTSASAKLEVGDGSVILRSGEWVCYDISHLDSGTYKVSIEVANTYVTKVNVYIDNQSEFLRCNVPATGSYKTYGNCVLGKMIINNGMQKLKISNSASNAIYLKHIRFEKLSDKTYFAESEIKGKDIFSDIEGEGFHDVAGKDYYSTSVTSGDDIILHKDDWAAYKTSNLKDGAYEIYVCASNQNSTTVEFFVNNQRRIKAELLATDSYNSFAETKVGTAYIADADKFTIKNMNNSMYLQYIKLRYKPDVSIQKESFINAKDVISDIDGEGFYDNQDINVNSGGNLELSGNAVVLRVNEWLRYDISYLSIGNYGIYVNASNITNSYLQIQTDNSAALKKRLGKKQSYSDYEEVCLGNIEVNEGTKTLQITNLSIAQTFIEKIKIKMIPITENLKYSLDSSGYEKINGFNGKDTVYVSGTISNECFSSEKIVLMSACYSNDSKLLSLNRKEIDCKVAETKDISVPVNVAENTFVIKTFIWGADEESFPIFCEKALYSGVNKHFYVDANSGSDEAAGTSESPFKTIKRAQEKIREENDFMTGDIYIHLSGTFKADETLEFTEADSGTNGYSIIYDGNDNAVITGGRKIEGFFEVPGTPLYKADAGYESFRQLYINGNRGERAKSKWLYYVKEEYTKPDREETIHSDVDGYILSGSDFPDEFKYPLQMEFVWNPSWKNIRMPVQGFTKNENNDYVVTFPQPYFDAVNSLKLSIPYYIENAPEFLDEPGEWYHNKTTGELFYYPYESENMETAQVYVPQTEMLLNVSGSDVKKVENITFKGLSFLYGAWNRPTEKGITSQQAEYIAMPENKTENDTSYPYALIPAQISVNYGKNINFIDNNFSHLGSVALAFDNKTENSEICGNIFDDISASAVTISNPDYDVGTKTEDFCRNIGVENNLIRRISVEYMTPAITAYYVNNTKISHNDILDCPYTGISLGWGWGRGVINCADNEVSYNRIENVLYKLKDGGHIYTLDIMDGTVVENNYLIKSGEDKGGIYLDNATENLLIRNNVFEDCPRWLKLTYQNVNNNTAYNNYSESKFTLKYPEINNIEKEIGKQDGKWSEEALNVIKSAGLEENYKHLCSEYDALSNYRNNLIKCQRYENKPGILIPAGDVMEGGEGVAYHDTTDGPFAVGITYEYDGTGHKYVMVTSQGEWTKYKFETDKSGLYNIYLTAAATSNYPRVSIWVDDVLVVNKGRIINTETYSVFEENKMGSVYLNKGPHTVKVEHTVSNFGFYSLRFATENDTLVRNDGFVESIVSEITKNK